jgi:ribosome-binding factor A
MASKARQYRVGDEIHKYLSYYLRQKANDPRFLWVSITEVVLSKDLAYAKVYFTALEKDHAADEIASALTNAKGFFRHLIAQQLQLRVAPILNFIFDESIIYGNKMDDLITKARDEDERFIKQDAINTDFDKEQIDANDDHRSNKRERLR